MATNAKAPKNAAACHPDCACPCCTAACPYCTLTALVKQLVAAGVCADVAATVAAEFVQQRCGESPAK